MDVLQAIKGRRSVRSYKSTAVSQEQLETLEVPDNIAVVGMTPLGYPDEEPTAPPRRELLEFVFYEKYGRGRA